jgi:hypothetical protein
MYNNKKTEFHRDLRNMTALILALMCAVAGGAAGAADVGKPVLFQAGRAQVKITPPLGVSLAGYFHERIAESVRDDLFARAVVIGNGETRLALVSLDLISITEEVTRSARELIEAKTGIAPGHVLVCATHTHTGPELRRDASMARADEWAGGLPAAIAEAVAQADAGKVPATLRLGSAEITGYSFNRLFRLKDGREVFGKGGREKEVIDTAGPIDPGFQTLSAVDQDGRLLALLVNFALHPDVIGGGSANFISADWPGLLGETVSKVYGEDVVTLMLQGTCGDINHRTHFPTALPTGGPAKAIQLGRGLAGAAILALERAEPMTDSRVAVANETLSIPYYTRDAALYAEIEALKQKENPSASEQSYIRRVEDWPYDGQMAEVPVQVFRIGGMGLVAFPAEIFVRIGLDVKRWSPAPQTFVVELANARVSSYVPYPGQAERGAYGTQPILSRWLHADAGRHMGDAAIRMLHQLFDGQ